MERERGSSNVRQVPMRNLSACKNEAHHVISQFFDRNQNERVHVERVKHVVCGQEEHVFVGSILLSLSVVSKTGLGMRCDSFSCQSLPIRRLLTRGILLSPHFLPCNIPRIRSPDERILCPGVCYSGPRRHATEQKENSILVKLTAGLCPSGCRLLATDGQDHRSTKACPLGCE